MSVSKRRFHLRTLLVVLSWLMGYPFQAWAEMPHEYQIKGAFLYKFARYVEWPAEAFGDGDDPIRIGILGQDPFGATLDQMVRGKKVQSREIEVKRFARIGDLEFCHILFISSSESKRLELILAQLEGKNTLTVGEMKWFCRDGGMIQLMVKDEMLRLEIRLNMAKRAGLEISSNLLKLARIVEE